MVRESLVQLLEAGGDVQVVAQAADGIEALQKAELTRPDIVVADLTMPRLGGLEVVRRLREKLPNTRVLVLTMHQEDEYVLQAVRAGASGYLVKDSAGSELLGKKGRKKKAPSAPLLQGARMPRGIAGWHSDSPSPPYQFLTKDQLPLLMFSFLRAPAASRMKIA